jgi:hypothetical protein
VIVAALWIALASSGPAPGGSSDPAPDGPVAAEPVAAAEIDVADRVVVVRNPDPDLDARLAAELRFLGFVAEVVDVPVPRDVAALHDLARVHDAAAAIAIHEGGASVWIGDRVTGKSVARALEPTQPDRPREIAVRTVELLRASLVELQHVPPVPEAEVASSPTIERTLSARVRARLVVAAMGAVGGAPGGLGVMGHVRASVRYAPHRHVGVVLSGTAPLHAAEVRGPEGRADVRTGWIGLGPWFGVRRRDAWVLPDLALGVGPAFVDMRGHAAAGRRSADVRVVDAMFEATAGLDVVLSRRIRLRLEASAGMCARTVRVRFSDRAVATWCRPHALAAIGLGVVAW